MRSFETTPLHTLASEFSATVLLATRSCIGIETSFVESPLAAGAWVVVMAEPITTEEEELVGLNQIRDTLRHFARDREWEKFHTPRNLLLALMGAVGELAGWFSSRPTCARPASHSRSAFRSSECFQWLGDDAAKPGLPGMDKDKKIHVGEELADVLLYVLRLADVCGIDMNEAVLDKVAKNAAKYPVELARGRASKYTELTEEGR